MKRLLPFSMTLLSAALLCVVSVSAEEKFPVMGKIERYDKRFDKLIAPGEQMHVIAKGHDWTEGPVWIPEDGGYLLYSDIPRNAIYKWVEGKGSSVFLQPAGYTGDRTDLKEPGTNGLIRGKDGVLYLCEHGDRRVTKFDLKTKKKIVLAHKYREKRLNSPNDGVLHSNGDLYFTDPPYGRMVKNKPGFPDRDLDFCGIYRLSKDGKLTLLSKEMSRPNGITLSPDEKWLYVANSDGRRAIWMKFPVKKDGTLGKGTVFYDVTKWAGKRPGGADGLKTDKDGNLWATGPGGLYVFAPDGTMMGRINTGDRTSNCNWGGDGSVLYLTVNHVVCRIQTLTRGSK